VARENILGDRQIGEHDGFLMDGDDARQLGFDRGGEFPLGSLEVNAPGRRPVETGEDFHEGRLPRSVLADQGVHFTRPDREVHIVEGFYTGEIHRDAPHLENVRVHWGSSWKKLYR